MPLEIVDGFGFAPIGRDEPYRIIVGNNPVNYMDPLGLDWVNDAANFSAGMGDTISFGGTAWIRKQWDDTFWGGRASANKCSGWYKGGEVAGYAWGVATFGVGATPRGWLLGRGGGLLNSNDYIRLGWSWKGSAMEGSEILRLAIGSKRLPFHWHFP
jgi:hypothetical protein